MAQGQRLPAERPRQSGHAIEARLYAEEPTNGFLPSTGTLHVWEPPHGMEGVRVDSSVEAGTEIGVYYDPLLAKIIAHGADRETALRKLVYALRHCAAQGVETNREFLIDVFEHEDFRAGRAHTGFQLVPRRHTEHDQVFVEVAQAYGEHRERARRKILPSVPIGYRNNPVRLQGTGYRFQVDGRLPATAGLRQAIHGTPGPSAGNGEQVTGHREEQTTANRQKAEILRITDQGVAAMVNGIHHHFDIHVNEDEYYIRSTLGQRTVVRLPRYPRRAGAGERQTANSPMPGQVLRVLVTQGQRVKLGDALIALEAMKMEQTIKATMDGVVGAILVKPGDIVAPGQKLVEIEG